MRTLTTLFLTLALAACNAAPPALPAGESIGEPLETRDVLTFAVVDSTPTEYFDQTLLVEATVTAVCERAGCWMQIEDDGRTAMVRWETGCGGKYKFPMTAIGQRVLIQGSFYPKELTPEDADHIKEESGGKVDVPLEGYEFNASAILVTTR